MKPLEKIAQAIHETEVAMFDSPTWLRRQAQARAAITALRDAGVTEGMLRAAYLDRTVDAVNWEFRAMLDAVLEGE